MRPETMKTETNLIADEGESWSLRTHLKSRMRENRTYGSVRGIGVTSQG
jgi:hypothetical protein